MTFEREIFVLATHPQDVRDETWPRLSALLDDSERQRAARFVFDRDRQAFVAAHALKRLMFAADTGVAATEWRFETVAGGKPYALPQRGAAPFFNLSHCDGLVACALSRDGGLGIDVECLGRKLSSAIADRHYAPEERAWLAELSGSDQQAGFFMLWTLKEALLKAAGTGLAQPLAQIIFQFDPLRVCFGDQIAGKPAFGDPHDWHFEQCRVGANHLLALAWNGAPARIVLQTVRLERLLERSTEAPDGGLAALVVPEPE